MQLLVGALNIVSGFGGLLSGFIADKIGRRRVSGLACAVTVTGAGLMAASANYAWLLFGRIITGCGVGACFQIAPLYIAEVAPNRVRGRLVTFFDLFINIGILVGYFVGWALAGLPLSSGWRWMLGIGAIPPALISVALVWMPESPRYLLRAGKNDEAAQVTQWHGARGTRGIEARTQHVLRLLEVGRSGTALTRATLAVSGA